MATNFMSDWEIEKMGVLQIGLVPRPVPPSSAPPPNFGTIATKKLSLSLFLFLFLCVFLSQGILEVQYYSELANGAFLVRRYRHIGESIGAKMGKNIPNGIKHKIIVLLLYN